MGESAGAAGSAFRRLAIRTSTSRVRIVGRRLSPEAIDALKAQCVMDPDVQVVVSDGLSTDAITANYEEILPPLLAGLKQAGLKVGTPFFVRYGRVKIEDQIGEILGAKVVILLVGERPGLRPVGEPLLLRGVLPAGGDHRRGRTGPVSPISTRAAPRR